MISLTAEEMAELQAIANKKCLTLEHTAELLLRSQLPSVETRRLCPEKKLPASENGAVKISKEPVLMVGQIPKTEELAYSIKGNIKSKTITGKSEKIERDKENKDLSSIDNSNLESKESEKFYPIVDNLARNPLDYFSKVDFVQKLKDNPRWTCSTKTKMPIDMPALRDKKVIKGASFKNGNQPFVTFTELLAILPNAKTATYVLNQSVDDICVLDVEPKCPAEIRDKLLQLPYLYCELSMSGKGYHMVFETPKDTKFREIVIGKDSLRTEGGIFEILLNHNVTFTGLACEPTENVNLKPIDAFNAIFEKLASEAELHSYKEYDTSDLPDIDDIPYGDEILESVLEAEFKKTPADYTSVDKNGVTYDDPNKYEFGVLGFFNQRLESTLKKEKYKDHEYTMKEHLVLLYDIAVEAIPYREKHDEMRDGMPFLMYSAKRLLGRDIE